MSERQSAETFQNMKDVIKNFVLVPAALLGRHQWSIGRSGLLILMFHRVLPDADFVGYDEQPGMVIAPETLEYQLSWISRHFDVVRLSDWVKDSADGRRMPRKACAITFDDGWRDNYQYAYPILKALKLPATIYLVAEYIGTSKHFWPNRAIHLFSKLRKTTLSSDFDEKMIWIKSLIGDVSSNDVQYDEAIARLKLMTDLELVERFNALEQIVSPRQAEFRRAMLDWNEIKEMADSGLIEYGSHTCRHVRMLPQLNHDLIEYEIVQSKRLIEQQVGRPVTTFCYPNGNRTPDADRIVRQNYEAAITTDKGWNNNRQDMFSLRRIGIHQGCASTRTRFLAQISGLI